MKTRAFLFATPAAAGLATALLLSFAAAMTIRPTDAAQDAELALQVMLTKGESVKAKPKEGMIGSYFERRVKLKVTDQ